MLTRPQDLLCQREAASLVWSIGVRIALLGVPIVLALLQISGLLESGIVAESDAEAMLEALLCSVSCALAWKGLLLVRQQRHIPAVGLAVVSFDVVLLALLPVVWMYTQPGPQPLPTFLLKNELFTVAVVLIGVNALALSPRYPAIMTAGAIAVHAVVALYVTADPRVEYTTRFDEHFTSKALNLGVVQGRVAALAALGTVLWFITRSARKLLADAVELEGANYEMRERQAQLVAEGRMSALASLVSGIAHELNSPLGTVQSSVQTTERCAQRLSDPAQDAQRTQRTLQVLSDSARVGGEAVERISGLLGSLKRFARLDEAEVQHVDLREELSATLSMLDEGLRGQALVRTDYQPLPALLCRPSELNQVFHTLAVNALQALGGRGELWVSARHDAGQIHIEFKDDGPGISQERMAQLFDIGLHEKGQRVGMGLGLVTGRRVIERHGGQMHVDSHLGAGTTFRIVLPVASPLHTASV